MSGPRCTAALAITAPTNAVSCCARSCMPVEAIDPPEVRDVTRKLAHYVVATRFEVLPEGVRREVGRSLRYWMGVAIVASRHEAVEIALAAVTPFSGPARAGVSGRADRLDVVNPAFIKGLT